MGGRGRGEARRGQETAGRGWEEREETEGDPNAPPVCLGGKAMKKEEQELQEEEEAEVWHERAAQWEGAVVGVLALKRVPSPLCLSLSRAKGSQTSVLPLYGERESMLP